MKPRTTPLDTVAAALGDVAGAMRRRRESREARAVVYDADGHGWVLDPDSDLALALAEVAEAMIDSAAAPPGDEPGPDAAP